MTMHKALHHSDDIDRHHMSRKEGGNGYNSFEIATIQGIVQYTKKKKKNSNKKQNNKKQNNKKQNNNPPQKD